MKEELNIITEYIKENNPLHYKKLIKFLNTADDEYFERFDAFLKKYKAILLSENKDLFYSAECYLKMIADMNYETVQFRQSNEYSSKTFSEVNERVYANPNIMEYYMHGLLLSQFLWKYHYDTLLYFSEYIKKTSQNIDSYLEIGGGHGLYVSEAAHLLRPNTLQEVVDISKSSLDLAKKMVTKENIIYTHANFFDFPLDKSYDFITLGEVIEHVEDPLKLLTKVKLHMTSKSRLFLSTPTNAPTIDHIYLFKNVEEIRKLIIKAGYIIEEERCFSSENIPIEVAEELNVSILYCGIIKLK